MKIGIDKLDFYVPPYYVDMVDLAQARGVDPDKYMIGLGQRQMAVTTSSQDVLTLAANAAQKILSKEDKQKIGMVIVGTESAVDESKATAINLHHLLGIQPFARAFDIKEACYGATAAVLMARDYVRSHPDEKVLVVASDIARYGLNTAGEATQGAGAVAMLICQNPQILELEEESLALTEDIYDFWRPQGEAYPRVDGKLSNETYMVSFSKVWTEYKNRYGQTFSDFSALAFHTPYTRMGLKALQPVIAGEDEEKKILENYQMSISYAKQVGNIYTGSLWLALISLLDAVKFDKGDRVGLFSYGSGAVAEFLVGKMVEGYTRSLDMEAHRHLLDNRKKLTVAEYEQIYQEKELAPAEIPYSLIENKNGVRKYAFD